MARISQAAAISILSRIGALGVDFHALGSDVVDMLLEEADARRYRKPANANGSRARCFHAYLTRRAAPRRFAGFV